MKQNKEYIPISVLDMVPVQLDSSAKEAFDTSSSLIQQCEKQGYNRYWLGEIHNVSYCATSATSVLICYLASCTNKIKLGSGGVMLPNHSPLAIAEQFGTLISLYPERIDLGLGRSPGTDENTVAELRRNFDPINIGLKNYSADIKK